MLLKITDKPAADDRGDAIEISFENAAVRVHCVTGGDIAAIAEQARQALERHFAARQAAPAAEALLASGTDFGSRLAGEHPALNEALAAIGQQDAAQLSVLIESARPGFLAQPWELLRLPTGQAPLALHAQAFIRRFRGPGHPKEYAEREYGLKVVAPVPDAVAELNRQLGTPQVAKAAPPAPLRILHIASRTAAPAADTALESSAVAFTTEGAIDYEIFPASSRERLQQRLSDPSQPVHIAHYDGDIILDGEQACLQLRDASGAEQRLGIADLARLLRRQNAAMLCLDIRACFRDGQPAPVAAGLSAAAAAASHAGLGNVLGTAGSADPWTSGHCFSQIYQGLAAGLSLERAVTAARASLSSPERASRFASQGSAPPAWPLIVHYGGQSLGFFESPQTSAPLAESQTLVQARQRLMGFKSSLLPPLAELAGGGAALSILHALKLSRRSLALTGPAGIGKTHQAHRIALYLSQRGCIDFAFYFDFGNESYTVDNMLEMIAPVLELSRDQLPQARMALKSLRCCFVLDGLPALTAEAGPLERADRQTLEQFIETLLEDGHILIQSHQDGHAQTGPSVVDIPLRPLLPQEADMLATEQLRNRRLSGRDDDDGWPALLAACRGNPFLIKHALPLLETSAASELAQELERRMPRQGSVVAAFYQWQWSCLSAPWQTLLLLCAEVDGLLLELLMVAIDQKEPFEPAKKLLALVGDPAAVFSQIIAQWERQGFLNRLPHGRQIDARCQAFLRQKRREQDKLGAVAGASLFFSQALCEGVRLLSNHLNGQQNPPLAHYLLMNRRHWALHLEKLWFAHDYRQFLSSKHALEQLMRQAQLGEESAEWSLKLLERSTDILRPYEPPPTEAALAWLTLALSTLAAKEAQTSPCLRQAAGYWQAWLDAQAEAEAEAIDRRQAPLFQQATAFLDLHYQQRQDWPAAIAVNQLALSIYTRHSAWLKVIQTLKALVRCHVESGMHEQALSLEERILNDIPYQDAPPGLHAQQLFDIALSRTARHASPDAQAALDRLKTMKEAKLFGDALDGLQADIHFQQENYAAAIPHYCKLWTRAIQAGSAPHIQPLRERLLQMEQALGAEAFQRHIDRELGDEIVRPQDYPPQQWTH
ncbi:hypothetical protein BI347_14830 [Chromobacterium sphagni]|uniref:NACHT domain-containing protein n=1 Tax=Chromobacterium sphagni TaxID=1903179 RepID=A0A1S1X5C3_9NEIS|nr:NACHT domain-containing protein [Chromobacterium sphagni]OHX14640.1 hypothetical protein BI347_14830 [Chromobacterium sphagni]